MAAYTARITDAQQVLSDDEIIALMPDSLIFITKLIDIPSVLVLIEKHGGEQIIIPKKQGVLLSHPLADIIGMKNFQELALHLGGQTLEIPFYVAIKDAMKHRVIREAAKKRHITRAKLAHRFEMTARQIRAIVNSDPEIKNKRDDRQQDLFT